jgi:hypothetical protein
MTKIDNHYDPAGLERVILKKIPKILLGGIFIPFFMSIFVRLFPLAGTAAEIEKHLISIDMFSISLFFIVASAAFAVTIVCVIVALMKGPGYVVDAYELENFEHPRLVHKRNMHSNR